MKDFNKIKEEIILQLKTVKYTGDLCDIANEIGFVIGNYIDQNNTLDDFIHGLKHGISLINGTH
jgi:hypothetical protein